VQHLLLVHKICHGQPNSELFFEVGYIEGKGEKVREIPLNEAFDHKSPEIRTSWHKSPNKVVVVTYERKILPMLPS